MSFRLTCPTRPPFSRTGYLLLLDFENLAAASKIPGIKIDAFLDENKHNQTEIIGRFQMLKNKSINPVPTVKPNVKLGFKKACCMFGFIICCCGKKSPLRSTAGCMP